MTPSALSSALLKGPAKTSVQNHTLRLTLDIVGHGPTAPMTESRALPLPLGERSLVQSPTRLADVRTAFL